MHNISYRDRSFMNVIEQHMYLQAQSRTETLASTKHEDQAYANSAGTASLVLPVPG